MNEVMWRVSKVMWVLIIASIGALIFSLQDSLEELTRIWETKEEYSYGYIIPFIAIFMLWQKKDVLQKLEFKGSWLGLVIALVSLCIYLMGELSTIHLLVQISFVFAIGGLGWSFFGVKNTSLFIIPVVILLFSIPLPPTVLNVLSAKLQLISSEIGVFIIRLFDISVYLEGNVIDLGVYKLQVVEACSGLRYLFPLMTLSFIAACFYKEKFYKRAILFISSIPITVVMNSVRIGIIGVMVEYWGPSMAEGFLHDFEGWIVFMACTAILVFEMWLMTRFSRERRDFLDVFSVDMPEPQKKGEKISYRSIPKSFWATALILIIIFPTLSVTLPERKEIVPERKDFLTFPTKTGDWEGRSDKLETIYLDVLKLNDYLMMNYKNSNNKVINFYIAYYESQKKGQSAHSPKTCIPGGGWQIKSLEQIPMNLGASDIVNTNRLVIQLGDTKQIVYYWFQQRGRNITSEYLVKWYIFWDALTKNRTDGALVRVTTMVEPGEDVGLADERILEFINTTYPKLPEYIPE